MIYLKVKDNFIGQIELGIRVHGEQVFLKAKDPSSMAIKLKKEYGFKENYLIR